MRQKNKDVVCPVWLSEHTGYTTSSLTSHLTPVCAACMEWWSRVTQIHSLDKLYLTNWHLCKEPSSLLLMKEETDDNNNSDLTVQYASVFLVKVLANHTQLSQRSYLIKIDPPGSGGNYLLIFG